MKILKLKKTQFYIAWMVLLSTSLISQYALAIARVDNCGPGKNGVVNFDYFSTFNISNNQAGNTSDWDQQGRVSTWSIGGHCGLASSRKSPVFWTFEAAQGVTYEQSGSDRWMTLANNDYIQIGMKLFIDGRLRKLVDVPAEKIDNMCRLNCRMDALAETASQAQIRIRIRQPFVGELNIANQRLLNIYGETRSTTDKGDIAAVVNLGLKIIVPQSCAVTTGDTITFDFKEIATAAFSNVGAGNRPVGINIQSESMTLECKSMAAEQMFKAILRAPNANANMILSNNADVGFQIAGADNQALIPNNENSKIQFKLDSAGKSNIELKAWPVSVTGQTPQAGQINSTAHISFQFD